MKKNYYFIRKREEMIQTITLKENPHGVNGFDVGDTTNINPNAITVTKTADKIKELLDEKQTDLLAVHEYVTRRIREETSNIIKKY